VGEVLGSLILQRVRLVITVARGSALVEVDALVERLALVGRAALVDITALVDVSALAATTNQKSNDDKRDERECQKASGINNGSFARFRE
jgi:hypothetical protein